MIERLKESSGGVIGFKVTGKMTDEDLKHFEPQIEILIAQRKHKPIGILADLSAMHGADLAARWDEMRFLQKHTDHIARMAVVGAGKWEETGRHLHRRRSRAPGRDPLLRRIPDPARLGMGAHRQARRGRSRPPDRPRYWHLEGLPPRIHGPLESAADALTLSSRPRASARAEGSAVSFLALRRWRRAGLRQGGRRRCFSALSIQQSVFRQGRPLPCSVIPTEGFSYADPSLSLCHPDRGHQPERRDLLFLLGARPLAAPAFGRWKRTLFFSTQHQQSVFRPGCPLPCSVIPTRASARAEGPAVSSWRSADGCAPAFGRVEEDAVFQHSQFSSQPSGKAARSPVLSSRPRAVEPLERRDLSCLPLGAPPMAARRPLAGWKKTLFFSTQHSAVSLQPRPPAPLFCHPDRGLQPSGGTCCFLRLPDGCAPALVGWKKTLFSG